MAPPSAAHHDAENAPEPDAGPELVLEHGENTTWRDVAFDPTTDEAVLVGDRAAEDGPRDVVATWAPQAGLEIVLDRPGSGLVDVSVDEEGRHLIVGLHDTILLGEPGDYRNVWNESEFSQADEGYTFYGLNGAFEPGHGHAVLAGSSLLRMDPDGSLETLHGGQNAFFRTLDWNPRASNLLVEAAVEEDQQRACEGTSPPTLFGTLWRTDGIPPSQGTGGLENVALYGNKEPGCGLANAIAHAPNGTFALAAGRDDQGASLYTWAADRPDDDAWRYQPTEKPEGPITCIAWHPTGRYAVTTGLDQDVVGLASDRAWAPLLHQGPNLHGCAMHPQGDYALGVGEQGALVMVPHETGPVVTVAHPGPGSLVAPQEEQRFLLDLIDRGGAGNATLTGTLDGTDGMHEAFLTPPWWELRVDTRNLSEGLHTLEVTAHTDAGESTITHPFLVNADRFTPETPRIQDPEGLDGQGLSTTGTFTIRWQPLDAPLHYQVRQEHTGQQTNATRILDAGDADELTVDINQEGTYAFSVRSVNAFNSSPWSSNVVVNVAFDEQGPQRGDGDFRTCSSPSETSDVSWRECVLGIDRDDDADTDGGGGSSGEDDGGGPDGEDDGGDEGHPVPGPGLVALVIASTFGALIRRG